MSYSHLCECSKPKLETCVTTRIYGEQVMQKVLQPRLRVQTVAEPNYLTIFLFFVFCSKGPLTRIENARFNTTSNFIEQFNIQKFAISNSFTFFLVKMCEDYATLREI